MDSMGQMEELLNETEQKLRTLERGPSDVMSQIEDLEQKLDQAQQITDKKERDARLEILNAEMKALRQQTLQEEKDLAEAVLGLNIMIEKMGGDYDALTHLNETEQSIIDRAESTLKTANEGMADAQSAWFFKESRIETAQAAIDKAQQDVEDAKTEAKRRMRQRLLTHSMEESLQDFQLKVHRTVEIMKTRLVKIEEQVSAVGARKEKAFGIKEQSAKDLESAKETVEKLENQLYEAEEKLNYLENGSSEYAAQEQTVSSLKSQLEDARGQRDISLGVYQSKEKFATELEIHEAAQKKLRNNQRLWIRALESDTEERVITFQSRLEAMKASSDQEIAKQLDDLGAEVDQSNADYMAKVAVSSDKIIAEKVGSHPQRLQKMADTQAAITEHLHHADENMKKMLEDMFEKYGIDPTKSQFSNYANQ